MITIYYKENPNDHMFVDKLIDKGKPPNNPATVHKEKCLHLINPSQQEAEITTTETFKVTFEWQKFDIERGEYQKDEEKTDAFQVEIIKPGGEIFDTVELPVGEELEFSAEEAGEYTIRTRNSKVGNAEIKVVVEDA